MTVTLLLGTDLPIIQAPMAGVQGSALAAAVCEAGALGSLPCAMLGPDAMRAEIETIRARTARPFNVNFFCHAPPARDPAREAAWLATLAPYYEEFGLDPRSIPSAGGRAPFSPETADAVEPFRPAVVSFHFGLPSPELLDRVNGWGSAVLATATTVEEARWLEDRGVDVVVAQGLEAGGHRGMFLTADLDTQAGTLALVPQVVTAVRVPVVAAGGIADVRGVKAALALGAAGVQVGTAYLLCPEATTSPIHRAELKGESARRTAVTTLFSGGPARGDREPLDEGPRAAEPGSPAVPARRPGRRPASG